MCALRGVSWSLVMLVIRKSQKKTKRDAGIIIIVSLCRTISGAQFALRLGRTLVLFFHVGRSASKQYRVVCSGRVLLQNYNSLAERNRPQEKERQEVRYYLVDFRTEQAALTTADSNHPWMSQGGC